CDETAHARRARQCHHRLAASEARLGRAQRTRGMVPLHHWRLALRIGPLEDPEIHRPCAPFARHAGGGARQHRLLARLAHRHGLHAASSRYVVGATLCPEGCAEADGRVGVPAAEGVSCSMRGRIPGVINPYNSSLPAIHVVETVETVETVEIVEIVETVEAKRKDKSDLN